MGPFSSSYKNKYISLAMDSMSKWVEVIATPTNDAEVVLNFMQKIIFAQFGTSRAIISDEGTHFCKKLFDALFTKYEVKHKTTLDNNPQNQRAS